MKAVRRLLLFAVGLAWSVGAQAAACSISGGGATLAFGNYRPLTFGTKLSSASVDSTTTITLNCAGDLTQCLNLTYAIAISAGSTGNVGNRGMPGSGTSAGSTMAYNLYIEPTRTTVWGDGISGVTVGGLNLGCGMYSHTVYGRVPAGQNLLRSGSYAEQLTITVTYSP